MNDPKESKADNIARDLLRKLGPGPAIRDAPQKPGGDCPKPHD